MREERLKNYIMQIWSIGSCIILVFVFSHLLIGKYGESFFIPLVWSLLPFFIVTILYTKSSYISIQSQSKNNTIKIKNRVLKRISYIYFFLMFSVLLFFQPIMLINKGIRFEETLILSFWALVPLNLLILYLIFSLIKEKREIPKNVRKILFLASNPEDTQSLKLDKEIKEIEEGIKLSKNRDEFAIIQKWATTSKDLVQSLLDEKPNIVHFSGHGHSMKSQFIENSRRLNIEKDGEKKIVQGIALEDKNGLTKIVSGKGLSNIFNLFSDTIDCVILNSCYSENQAVEIVKQIPFVIGMKSSIPDTAAIAFSIGFYKALGNGKSIEFAFQMGKASIELEVLNYSDLPVLLQKK